MGLLPRKGLLTIRNDELAEAAWAAGVGVVAA
jgi:hypothetical protein